MSWLSPSRRRRPQDRSEAGPEPLNLLAQVEAAVAQFDRARSARDASIRAALNEHTQRKVAETAKLSLTRVRQLMNGGQVVANRTPVTEVDLHQVDVEDRVLGLLDVDPHIEAHPSEREFLAQRPERLRSDRYDLNHRLCDTDPTREWAAVYIVETRELYAFLQPDRDAAWAAYAHPRSSTPASNPADMRNGSTSGPCYLLGHVISWPVVETAIDRTLSTLARRPGGIAWLYGRIQLLNRTLGALDDSTPFNGTLENLIAEYQLSLPDPERR